MQDFEKYNPKASQKEIAFILINRKDGKNDHF